MRAIPLILLAFVILLLLIALVIWLVLRNKAESNLPRGTATYSGSVAEPAHTLQREHPAVPEAAGEPEPAPGPEGIDSEANVPLADDLFVADHDADLDATHAAEGVTAPPEAEQPEAAEEFVGDGLSELDDMTEEIDDGEVSGSPPQTPTEAFGAAAASTDESAAITAAEEASVLDDDNVDSTPLFRSMRQERFGAESHGDRTNEPVSADTTDALTTDGATRPGKPPTTPIETPTEGVVATGAVGVAAIDSTAQEEDHVTVDPVNAEPLEDDEVAVAADVGAGDSFAPIRISELHEVTDGGFGIGSAAPLADGAQPLGHAIKANLDTKTYQDFYSPWYDETQPDVWFLDAGFAERAGFHRAE